MTATELDVLTLTTRNPDTDGGDTIEWQAADPTNGNSYRATGRETLIAYNPHNTDTFTVTIESVADRQNRTLDVQRYVEAGETVVWQLEIEGWRRVDGYVYLSADSSDVLLAVTRPPAR